MLPEMLVLVRNSCRRFCIPSPAPQTSGRVPVVSISSDQVGNPQ